LIDNLESGIAKLKWEPAGTEWGDYYDTTNYTSEAFEHKKTLVDDFLKQIQPAGVWDMGANTGEFSRLASQRDIPTIAFDIDPGAVENAYIECRAREDKHLLPLILDLTNPSPSIGWDLNERSSLLERGPTDMILALALIHHLAIGNNVPFEHLASFFSGLCKWLVIEFVPKSDTQVQRMLATRVDIFSNYTVDAFDIAFKEKYKIVRSEAIRGSERRLYLMERC
jgi:ribosomal protein L11 methylase PrmA